MQFQAHDEPDIVKAVMSLTAATPYNGWTVHKMIWPGRNKRNRKREINWIHTQPVPCLPPNPQVTAWWVDDVIL